MIYTSYTNGDETEQYQYYFRPFMNASGEIIGGYTNQIATNDIIASQQSGDKQIIQAIESGNKEIINAIDNANNNYWGKSGDISSNEKTEEIENILTEQLNNISGELNNNEIIQMLISGEQGFFDFFTNEHEEEWYDLIIKWPNIKSGLTIGNNNTRVDKTIISGDSINISEAARNNPALKQARDTLRIIVNFMITIALIKQIYNLLLSTLGIDNPYLYEEPGLETQYFEDLDTGHAYNTYRGVGISGNPYTLRKEVRPGKRRKKL